MSAPQDDTRESAQYRGRRLIDAVRFLPWVALIFFILPALLVPAQQSTSTSASLLYFIGCWFILIGAAFVISRALRRRDVPRQDNDPPW